MNYLFYHCLTTLAEFIIGNAGLHEWEHKNNFIENNLSLRHMTGELNIDGNDLIYSSHCLASAKNQGLFSIN